MKKFLLTFVFLCVVLAAKAQSCADSFTAVPTMGNCFSDATLKVTLPAGCTGNYLAVLTPPQGVGTTEYQQLTGTPASYTFNALRAGVYTVTIMNQTTGDQTAPKAVDVTSNYKIMDIRDIKQESPTCLTQKDGKISFRIPTGGTGPFRVSVEDPSGTILFSPQDFNRPVGSNVISIQGGVGSNSIPLGNVVLVIEDLAAGVAQCGETRRIPMAVTGVIRQNYECLGLKTYLYLIEKQPGTCKYRLRYKVTTRNGSYIYSHANFTILQNLLKQPGTMVLENITKGTITDFSTGLNGEYFYTNYDIDEGDEIKVKMRIDVPSAPPVFQEQDHFKLENIANKIDAFVRSSTHYQYTEGCPPTYRAIIQLLKYGITNIYTDLTNPAKKINVTTDWIRPYSNQPNYIDVYKFDTGTNTWTGPLLAPSQIQKNGANVDVTDSGNGRYKIVYKLSAYEGCYPDIEREAQVTLPPPPTSTALKNTINHLSTGIGVYEGMSFVQNYFFEKDMKLRLERTDGQTMVAVQTKLPVEANTYTRTMKFPLEIKGTNVGFYNIGDVPPGEYIATVTDVCGSVMTKTLNITTGRPPLKYKSTITKDCQLGTYTYDFEDRSITTQNLNTYLFKKEISNTGQVTWRSMLSTHPNISGHTGTFANLPAGEYRIEHFNYVYTFVQPTYSRVSGGYTFFEEILNGNPYYHSSSNIGYIKDYAYFLMLLMLEAEVM